MRKLDRYVRPSETLVLLAKTTKIPKPGWGSVEIGLVGGFYGSAGAHVPV